MGWGGAIAKPGSDEGWARGGRPEAAEPQSEPFGSAAAPPPPNPPPSTQTVPPPPTRSTPPQRSRLPIGCRGCPSAQIPPSPRGAGRGMQAVVMETGMGTRGRGRGGCGGGCAEWGGIWGVWGGWGGVRRVGGGYGGCGGCEGMGGVGGGDMGEIKGGFGGRGRMWGAGGDMGGPWGGVGGVWGYGGCGGDAVTLGDMGGIGVRKTDAEGTLGDVGGHWGGIGGDVGAYGGHRGGVGVAVEGTRRSAGGHRTPQCREDPALPPPSRKYGAPLRGPLPFSVLPSAGFGHWPADGASARSHWAFPSGRGVAKRRAI